MKHYDLSTLFVSRDYIAELQDRRFEISMSAAGIHMTTLSRNYL